MATSVCSLGVAAGIGTLFQSISRGELPELTQLVYEARERCLERLRHEGEMIGAERVMGNRLVIRELSRGLIEIVAIGTAVRRADPSFQPATPSLPVQAVTVGQSSLQMKTDAPGIVRPAQMASSANRAAVVLRLAVIVMVIVMSLITSLMARSSRSSHPHRGTPAAVTT
jgi:uncharacterized protein YbjQ (UPF0145 family)